MGRQQSPRGVQQSANPGKGGPGSRGSRLGPHPRKRLPGTCRNRSRTRRGFAAAGARPNREMATRRCKNSTTSLRRGTARRDRTPYRPAKAVARSIAATGCEATLRQASAQPRQACAHIRQCSWACLLHSSAQASQSWAQKPQVASADSLPRAMTAAARRHAWAQSMSRAMQRARCCGFASPRQAIEQWSQALAQALQASMHELYCC